MLQQEVFVVELRAIDAGATRAVAMLEVPSLEHEPVDHPVEGCAAVSQARLLSGAQLPEVLCRLWDNVGEELNDQAADILVWGCSSR